MSFTKAGRYGPFELLSTGGVPLPSISCLVKTSPGGATATLYTDATKGSTATNPVVTDLLGNLTFFADPGDYTITPTVGGVAQTPFTVTVPIDPVEATQDTTDTPFSVSLGAASSGGVPVTIQGNASTYLTQWRDATLGLIAYTTAGGRQVAPGFDSVPSFNNAGVTVSSAAGQTGNMVLAQDGSNNPILRVSGTATANADTVLVTQLASKVGLVVKALSGSGDLQQWQSSGAAQLVRVSSQGRVVSDLAGGGLSESSVDGAFVINTRTSGTPALSLVGRSGQTGNVFQVVDSTPTVNFSIAASGTTSWITGANLSFGTAGAGTKIGTATNQKIGFWNATPIVQPTTGGAASTFVANTSAIANDSATWDGYTIGNVVKALRNEGLLA